MGRLVRDRASDSAVSGVCVRRGLGLGLRLFRLLIGEVHLCSGGGGFCDLDCAVEEAGSPVDIIFFQGTKSLVIF